MEIFSSDFIDVGICSAQDKNIFAYSVPGRSWRKFVDQNI
jgi:hypothetical protein